MLAGLDQICPVIVSGEITRVTVEPQIYSSRLSKLFSATGARNSSSAIVVRVVKQGSSYRGWRGATKMPGALAILSAREMRQTALANRSFAMVAPMVPAS